ncbi:restriction endonuclease subunit S [Amycolatopsis tolypomycina]|uniref:restriction endonuclease subunit S n=1 Tax=Amycolatopsis tolypomycina TaxID=208445 RepID=UPI00339EED8C
MTGEVRLRHVADINPPTPEFALVSDDAEITFLPLEAVWPGSRLDTTGVRPKSSVTTGYTRFRENDILIPKITPTFEADRSTIARRLMNGVAAGTTELHVVRPRANVCGRYIDYLVSSRPFLLGGEAEMIGVAGQKRVPASWLRDFPVPITVRDTQEVIADFLDSETARIDALLVKKQNLMELVHYRYRVQVDELTGHGNAVRVRRVAESITSGPRGWSEQVGEVGAPFIRSANLRRDEIVLRSDNVMRVDVALTAEAARSQVRQGDTLVGITGANTGWVGLVGNNHAGGFISQHVARVRPRGVVPEWVAFSIFSQRSQEQLLGGQYGGTKQQLGLEDLAELTIQVPSLEEQRELVCTLQRAAQLKMELTEKLGRQIDLLKEHRQALITAAVTGEMKVPGVS